MSNLDDIKDVLRELKDRDQVYIQNQELCQELGKQKERATFLDHVIQNAKLEIQNRENLIQKVIQENERLEKELKGQKNYSQMKEICRDNENLKKELESCKDALKNLEERYGWAVQCLQEKDTFIETLEKKHAQTLEKICVDVQQMKKDKKCLEDKLKEEKEGVGMLKKELSTCNEKYECVSKTLKDKTRELEDLKIEYEKYRQSVEMIKEYVMKTKVTSNPNACNKPAERTKIGDIRNKDIHTERWKGPKNTKPPRELAKTMNENQLEPTQPIRNKLLETSKTRSNFSSTYINARKRMTGLMTKNLCFTDTNNNFTVAYAIDVNNSNDNPNVVHNLFPTEKLGSRTGYSPEPVRNNYSLIRAFQDRCSSDSNLSCIRKTDWYRKYANAATTRARSALKKTHQSPHFGHSPDNPHFPGHKTYHSTSPPKFRSPSKKAYPSTSPPKFRVSDLKSSSSDVHENPFQSLRLAVCHAKAVEASSPPVHVSKKPNDGAAELYKPRSEKLFVSTLNQQNKNQHYQQSQQTREPAREEDNSESYVEIETKVQNLSGGKVKQRTHRQSKEKSHKPNSGKKFKLF